MKKLKWIPVLAVYMIVMLASVSVNAETNKRIIDTSANEWISVNAENDQDDSTEETDTYYKIVVPKESIVIFSKNTSDEELILYDSEYKRIDSLYNKAHSLLLKEGIYYLGSYNYIRNDVKVKYTFRSFKHEENYCLRKAKSLKEKKKIYIVQTRQYNYGRWYKIKLTKKKRIDIKCDFGVRVYDSKFRSYTVDSNSTGYNTVNKLKKGTYYIYVSAPDVYNSYYPKEYVGSLYWK